MGYSGREGVDWTSGAAFLSSTPPGTGRGLMVVGPHIFLKDTDLDGYRGRGDLEGLGCGVNMIRTYMKFSKNKLKKKQTKFSFLSLTPVLPKGVSISVAFFYCGALDPGGSDCGSGGPGELGGSHS